MAADPIDLIDIARAQQNPALASTNTTLLQSLITAASQQIINFLNRDIKTQTYTAQRIDGEGWQTLFLEQFPVTDIVQLDFINNDATVQAVMPNGANKDLYFFVGDSGEIDFVLNNPSGFTIFPKGFKNIRTTYVAGFAVVPADIQEATAEQTVFLLEQGSAQSNVASEKLADYSKTFFNPNSKVTKIDFSATAFRILSSYRRFLV